MTSTKRTPTSRLLRASSFAVLFAVAAASGVLASGLEPSSYGYVRALEGDVTVYPGASEAGALLLHQPILTGDHLVIETGALLEIELADGLVLRAAGPTELVFDQLAHSEDSDDQLTVIRLLDGELQAVRPLGYRAGDAPRIDTESASLYLFEDSEVRVFSDGGGSTQFVARRGGAELLTRDGSVIVRAGEEAWMSGASSSVDLGAAPAADDLELWGRELDARWARGDGGAGTYEEPLDEHGDWVEIEGERAWQPAVSSEWSPYVVGDWQYTPSGLFWVSGEPWGWVTYHYGSWNYDPYWGWAWYPGARFAPAWVYWYWGPSYVGWCPTGYYDRYYGYGGGLRFGVYGWAGGSFGAFAHWNFVSHDHFGRREQRRHVRRGRDMGHAGDGGLERGLVTTDTRGLGRDRWREPEEAMRALRKERQPGRFSRIEGDLPDVTPFVARQSDLSRSVRERVFAGDVTGQAFGRPGVRVGSDDTTRPADAPRRDAVRSPAPRTWDRDWQAEGRKPEAGARGVTSPLDRPRIDTAGIRRDRGVDRRETAPGRESRPTEPVARGAPGYRRPEPGTRPSPPDSGSGEQVRTDPRDGSVPPRRDLPGETVRPEASPRPDRLNRPEIAPRPGRLESDGKPVVRRVVDGIRSLREDTARTPIPGLDSRRPSPVAPTPTRPSPGSVRTPEPIARPNAVAPSAPRRPEPAKPPGNAGSVGSRSRDAGAARSRDASSARSRDASSARSRDASSARSRDASSARRSSPPPRQKPAKGKKGGGGG